MEGHFGGLKIRADTKNQKEAASAACGWMNRRCDGTLRQEVHQRRRDTASHTGLGRHAVPSSEEAGWSGRKADSLGRLSTAVLGNPFLIGDGGQDLADCESLDDQLVSRRREALRS
jgi:hypothetical protein